ncbi:MAG: hypothetical protein JNM18_09910 [Planctomycetaceae bacterium]|nr:hypothetical protein [Planctomycetaceae bacterium]
MANGLSPQNEQFLNRAIAEGLFPSTEAALDAAVSALREQSEAIPFVPAEHAALVDAAIEAANAGQSREMTAADWESLRQKVRSVAHRNSGGA